MCYTKDLCTDSSILMVRDSIFNKTELQVPLIYNSKLTMEAKYI